MADTVPGVDEIIRYEQGDMSEEEEREFFLRLVASGLIYELQGHYGRTAHAMGLL